MGGAKKLVWGAKELVGGAKELVGNWSSGPLGHGPMGRAQCFRPGPKKGAHGPGSSHGPMGRNSRKISFPTNSLAPPTNFLAPPTDFLAPPTNSLAPPSNSYNLSRKYCFDQLNPYCCDGDL